MLLEQLREGLGPGLLLTFDEDGHSDGELVAVGTDGRQVGGNAGLVASCCSSWWAYGSTVGRPAGAGLRATTAGAASSIATKRTSNP
jgi:hypothetical protein